MLILVNTYFCAFIYNNKAKDVPNLENCGHQVKTYPCVKVLWSDIRLKWSKSWSQYLQWSSVDWVLLVRVVVHVA